MIDNKKIRDLVKDVFKSNDEYSLTQKFEEEFCEKFGVKYAVSINSATSGLHAALAAQVLVMAMKSFNLLSQLSWILMQLSI